LENVFSHTAEGAAFTVRLSRRAGGGAWLVVADDGPGFPDAGATERGRSSGGSTRPRRGTAPRSPEAPGGSPLVGGPPSGGGAWPAAPARRPAAAPGEPGGGRRPVARANRRRTGRRGACWEARAPADDAGARCRRALPSRACRLSPAPCARDRAYA